MWRRLPWVLTIIVVGIVVLLGVIATWLLIQKAEQENTPNSSQTLLGEREQKTCGLPSAETVAAQETVLITGVGFDPAEVAVKVGQTVRWVNNGTSIHRVAVEPHPMHNVCIGLDSKDLGPDESFGFTFTKPGEWIVHDDNHLSSQGKVVVTE